MHGLCRVSLFAIVLNLTMPYGACTGLLAQTALLRNVSLSACTFATRRVLLSRVTAWSAGRAGCAVHSGALPVPRGMQRDQLRGAGMFDRKSGTNTTTAAKARGRFADAWDEPAKTYWWQAKAGG